MTAPVKPQMRRTQPLPEPELVSLMDDPEGPYAGTEAGWWTEYGGALARTGGVVYLPPGSNPPPSPFKRRNCGGGV